MDASPLTHVEHFDESTDRDDTGTDMLKFLGACALVALLGLGGLVVLFYNFG